MVLRKACFFSAILVLFLTRLDALGKTCRGASLCDMPSILAVDIFSENDDVNTSHGFYFGKESSAREESIRVRGGRPQRNAEPVGKATALHLIVSFALFYASVCVILISTFAGPGIISEFWYMMSVMSCGMSLASFFIYGLIHG